MSECATLLFFLHGLQFSEPLYINQTNQEPVFNATLDLDSGSHVYSYFNATTLPLASLFTATCSCFD
jgi:hypothetical protein